MLKIVYPICCGLDVHKDFVYACIATTENGVTTYKSHRFSTFTKGIRECYLGFWQTTAKMFVWNLRESIGFLSTTSSKPIAKSFWLILNMSKQFAARKPTRKIPSGLRISLSTILFREALFLLRIFVSFGIGSLSYKAHKLYYGRKELCAKQLDRF